MQWSYMSIKSKYFDTSSFRGVLFLNMLRCNAIRILDVLEEMLEDKGIAIPDEERTSDESEACLYGMTYADLENEIAELLGRYYPSQEK